MPVEQLEVFNQEGTPLGLAKRSKVHKKGLFHQAVIILVFNGEGELFLQKRSMNKDICPGF